MNRYKAFVLILLSSFFTQQVLGFSWEIIENNTEIVIEENIPEENISIQTNEIEEYSSSGEEEHKISEENNQENSWDVIWEESNIESIDSLNAETGEEIEEQEENIEEQEKNIEENIEEEIVDEIDFSIKFQNPSYILDKDIEKTEYICDSEKDECKINIVFVDSTWENLSSDYECFTEYSQWFESDNRCNPTTIILTETTQVNYSVYIKNKPENKIIKSINFIIEISISEEEEEEEEEDDTQEEALTENSENNTWTWETIDGENNDIESWTGDTSENWVILDENVNIDEDTSLPEIILEVQSWLEYSGTWNIYICEKQDCKINLDISESFTGWFVESDFSCEWNFWSGSFSTQNTDKKCNPGYVNYGSGIHDIFTKIIDRNNIENFTWATFQIHNIISIENNVEDKLEEQAEVQEDEEDENTNNSWNWTTSTGSIITVVSTSSWSETWTGNLIPEILLFPEIIINIQSWADYLDTENIKCNKEDCKINLDISEIFDNEFLENNYNCLWNFGNGTFSSPETVNKCNPGYIDYNIWDDSIKIILFEKENPENYIEKIIYIQNPIIIKQSSWSSWWSNSNNNISVPQKDYGKITEEKNIIIQSGLENDICNEEKCKINLDYENASYESCSWNFWNIEVQEKYKNTCNPWFIYANSWVHKITLEIYNSKTNSNYTKNIIFSNNYIEEISQENFYFDIILQWKSLDYKKYYNDKIICLWVDTCSINLVLDTNHKEDLNYKWDFWNWVTSDSKNPKSVWFWTGSYQLSLDINWKNISEIKKINIEVTWKVISVEQQNIVEEFKFEKEKENSLFNQFQTINFSDIELWFNNNTNIFENNIIKNWWLKLEDLWWFAIENTANKRLQLTRNVSQQKKSLKYSGRTFPKSDIFILQWDKIIELQSDEEWKYSQNFTNISAGNYGLEYYVLDSEWNLFENKKEKLLILSDDYVNNIKYNNLNKVVKKVKKIKKIPKKIIDNNIEESINNIQYASLVPEITLKTTIWEYMFQLLLLLLSLLWGSVLFKKYKIL